MKRIRILATALALMSVLQHPVPAAASAISQGKEPETHTENDLREIMGLERIEGEEWEAAAAGILAQCTSRDTYNELVDGLADLTDESAKALGEQAGQKQEYYEEYKKRFLAGEAAEDILEPLAQYNRLYLLLNQTVRDTAPGNGPERFGRQEIEERAEYAKALLALCEGSADIGQAGQNMDTFLKADLRIREIAEDSVACYTAKGDSVYSQFNGTVTDISENAITIKSGETIALTYTGIQAAKWLSAGCGVKQYQRIGKASGESISLQMESCLQGENPLKMYGTRAEFWQEAYLRTQPAESFSVDFSWIKDDIEKEPSAVSSLSTMTDENGNETALTAESNPYTAGEIVLDDEELQLYKKGE